MKTLSTLLLLVLLSTAAYAQGSIVAADPLIIDSTRNCWQLTLYIGSASGEPLPLQSIRLDSVVNTKIKSILPFPIAGATTVTVVIEPIDWSMDASANILIRDSSGGVATVPFRYFVERIATEPAAAQDFGVMPTGSTATHDIIFTNTSDRPLRVVDIEILEEEGAFTVIGIAPGPLPLILKPGEFMTVTVQAAPMRSNHVYSDTLRVAFGCSQRKVALGVRTSSPRIDVGDVDFGHFSAGFPVEPKAMSICNTGGDTLSFQRGPEGEFIEWSLHQQFLIAREEIERLDTTRLVPGECIDIMVSFGSRLVGNFRDTARLFASTGVRKDYSIWTAYSLSLGLDDGEQMAFAATLSPNPATSSARIGFWLERPASVSLVITDGAGRQVASIDRDGLGIGDQAIEWNALAVESGIYFYRLRITPWDASSFETSGAFVIAR